MLRVNLFLNRWVFGSVLQVTAGAGLQGEDTAPILGNSFFCPVEKLRKRDTEASGAVPGCPRQGGTVNTGVGSHDEGRWHLRPGGPGFESSSALMGLRASQLPSLSSGFLIQKMERKTRTLQGCGENLRGYTVPGLGQEHTRSFGKHLECFP